MAIWIRTESTPARVNMIKLKITMKIIMYGWMDGWMDVWCDEKGSA